jgi:3-phenylpropionate/trans-cinnamate dioxygenase ferredoxin component
MVLAMLLGGLRRSEMLGIRMQDVSAGERRQRVGVRSSERRQYVAYGHAVDADRRTAPHLLHERAAGRTPIATPRAPIRAQRGIGARQRGLAGRAGSFAQEDGGRVTPTANRGLGSIETGRVRGSTEGGAMSAPQRVGAAADLPPGKVVGVGRYAVGNAGGRYFAVTRRCRHLGADLAGGSIDGNGCLVCPWHRSAYDVGTGRMVRGPQGIFAKVPGLDFGYRVLTRVLPLGRAPVTERNGELYIGG